MSYIALREHSLAEEYSTSTSDTSLLGSITVDIGGDVDALSEV